MDFIQQNLLLVVLVVVSGGMLLASFQSSASELSPADATLKINREDALVIDVRSPGEFAEGHIADSKNLPLEKLNERLAEFEKFKSRPIILSCKSGARSGGACGILRKNGFEKVFTLAGGMTAWLQAGLPVKRGAK